MSDVTNGTSSASMTIDQLAQRTGMTVRNIRAHQSRGLLPPPEVRGRTGYYGEEHLARLELVRELQADGFNLEAIRRLLDGAGGSSREVLDFTRAVKAPFEEEAPEVITGEELADRWGGAQVDPGLLDKALGLGLLRPLGEGKFEVLSPRLQRAGAELARLGIPPETALAVAAKIRRHAQGVARTFTQLYLEEVWKPFDAAGRPEERWPEVRESLERLRPLASEALLALFQLVMTEAVEEAFGRVIEREPAAPEGRADPAPGGAV